MSLKVLLADESPTIKKAFEIALKDYGVKIQSVHQGIDVKEVCENFKPHICFLDVLLPKLNGYDASAQLKAEPHLSKIPTVIMWSGFMEIDEDKFMTSGADDKIEKPFETPALRELIQKLVPSLQSNEISKYVIHDPLPLEDDLGIPDTDPGIESAPPVAPQSPPQTPTQESVETAPPLPDLSALEEEAGEFSIEPLHETSAPAQGSDFEELNDIENFQVESLDDHSLPLDSSPSDPDGLEGLADSLGGSSSPEDDIFGSLEGVSSADPDSESVDDLFNDLPPVPQPTSPETQQTAQQPVQQIEEVHIPSAPEPEPELEEFSLEPLPLEPLKESLDHDVDSAPEAPHLPDTPVIAAGPPPVEIPSEPVASTQNDNQESQGSVSLELDDKKIPQLSKDELKRLILAQSKDIIESVVWDVVPELARELIQKEITKLMGKAEESNIDGSIR